VGASWTPQRLLCRRRQRDCLKRSGSVACRRVADDLHLAHRAWAS
jgi:hypothetical protein